MTQTVSLYNGTCTEGYNEAYIEGYNAALREIREAKRAASHIREYKPDEVKVKAERLSFLIKQKLAGCVLMAASVIGLAANKGDFAVALFTIPLSALIIITNKRLFK